VTTPTTELAGHTFALDRAPYDDPIGLTTWRYRWNCGCDRTGVWRASEALARHGWALHVRRMTQMEASCTGRAEVTTT
jgi:hypothetical protein